MRDLPVTDLVLAQPVLGQVFASASGSGPFDLEPRVESGTRRGLVGVGGLLTHEQRIANYCVETGHPRSLFVSEDGRMVGTWIMGNDYRVKSSYYGGYPAGYLKRVKALFPDKFNVLHLFSGKVDVGTLPGKTVDINAENAPDYVDDAQTLERVPLCDFDLVCADPPYSVEDCDHYKTTMVKRNVVMRVLGERLRKGTHVVWLDQVLPMYRKDQFSLEAVIGMVKSTNHRFRVCSIFRAGGGGAEHGESEHERHEGKVLNVRMSDAPPQPSDSPSACEARSTPCSGSETPT